ncbi:MAG: Gfo/Idh/MocA family oxidoreductase [Eubacteriales bacterium]|nr:Gfo/Idh/MocA family oxidoreductase [Eubacteriales bacterium]
MKQITVAIAGCGARGMDTYAKCVEKLNGRAKIVAAADIDPEKLQMMRHHHGLSEAQCYPSADAMLAAGRLADVMFICTPDRLHYAQARKALELDYHLLLEKPISPIAEECAELAALAGERKRLVVVCHVLRYTPFYRELKRLLDSGVLGELSSIQAIEQVAYWHQAHSFVRGNWRNAELSSCMILQKCCHDMDILLWLAGKHAKRVSSFGSLQHFKAENAPEGAPLRCTDGCPHGDTCPYNAVRFYTTRFHDEGDEWPVNVVAPEPTEEKLAQALREGPYGRCVYHCDNDVVDHQVVNLELENGATVNFTMCAFTAHGGRNIRLMGTHGEIFGDMKANTIRVMPFVGEEKLIDVSKLADDFSGHGGGDARMVDELIHLLEEGDSPALPLTSIDRSVESHLVAFAAEKSRLQNGMVVDM